MEKKKPKTPMKLGNPQNLQVRDNHFEILIVVCMRINYTDLLIKNCWLSVIIKKVTIFGKFRIILLKFIYFWKTKQIVGISYKNKYLVKKIDIKEQILIIIVLHSVFFAENHSMSFKVNSKDGDGNENKGNISKDNEENVHILSVKDKLLKVLVKRDGSKTIVFKSTQNNQTVTPILGQDKINQNGAQNNILASSQNNSQNEVIGNTDYQLKGSKLEHQMGMDTTLGGLWMMKRLWTAWA